MVSLPCACHGREGVARHRRNGGDDASARRDIRSSGARSTDGRFDRWFGNAAGIFTPIGIGYILAATDNNWNMALLFVFAHSIVAMVSYLFITGTIKRVVLRTA